MCLSCRIVNSRPLNQLRCFLDSKLLRASRLACGRKTVVWCFVSSRSLARFVTGERQRQRERNMIHESCIRLTHFSKTCIPHDHYLQMWFHEVCDDTAGPYVAIGFATADRSSQLLKLGSKHIVEQFVAQIDRIFSQQEGRAEAQLMDAIVSSFDDNPYIRGAYRCRHCNHLILLCTEKLGMLLSPFLLFCLCVFKHLVSLSTALRRLAKRTPGNKWQFPLRIGFSLQEKRLRLWSAWCIQQTTREDLQQNKCWPHFIRRGKFISRRVFMTW